MSGSSRPPAKRRSAEPSSYLYDHGDSRLIIHTKPGVFSADGPDVGTTLLLELLLPTLRSHQRVLDLGCGAGLIGLSAAQRIPEGEVWCADSDIRCIRLTEHNRDSNRLANVQIVLSDVTADLPAKLRFHVIASNPPTHDGKEVLRHFVREAHSRLRPNGYLWLVVNRLLSVEAMVAETFGSVELMGRRRGFLVFRAKRVSRP